MRLLTLYLWLESLLKELIVPCFPPTLLCDNLSAILLSHNPILHARTKHIELDINFVRERVIAKAMKIQHLPSLLQLAYTLMKPLGTHAFQDIRTKFKVLISWVSILEEAAKTTRLHGSM